MAEVPQKVEEKIVQSSSINQETITIEYGITSPNQSDGDFYLLEELEQLEDESMALIVKRFGKFRFRRNPNFKFNSNVNRFQRGGSSTSNSSREGYKTGMVDRSKIRCFLLLNARSQGNSRILLMMSVRRRKQKRLT